MMPSRDTEVGEKDPLEAKEGRKRRFLPVLKAQTSRRSRTTAACMTPSGHISLSFPAQPGDVPAGLRMCRNILAGSYPPEPPDLSGQIFTYGSHVNSNTAEEGGNTSKEMGGHHP